MSAPNVLVPIQITDAMLTSSTAPEPAAGETAWNAATSYTVGQECILTSTHRVYACQISGVDAISPHLALTGASPRWKDIRATNRWSCLDMRRNNQTVLVTPFTMVLRPGIFNAIKFYGLDGSAISVSIKDAPGGTVFYTHSADLMELPMDHYDYYFGRIKPISKVLCSDIVPYEDPEVTITITAGTGATVKAGIIAIGDMRQLLADPEKGGTQYGASAKPVTGSYVAMDSAGYNSINSRAKGTDLDIRVQVPIEDANSALSTLQDVLDVPVSWMAGDAGNFSGLDSFGIGSGSVSYAGPEHAVISINVRGIY